MSLSKRSFKNMVWTKGSKYPFERVSNDVNGNPRYVLHFLAFAGTYEQARIIANRMGWSAYRAKSHGGCFVGQSYSIEDTANRIQDLRRELAAAERVIEIMNRTTYIVVGMDTLGLEDFYVAFDSLKDAEERYQQEIDAGAYSVSIAEVIRSTDYEVAA